MRLLVIVNPNTSTATTDAMVAVARQELAGTPDIQVQGVTASSGPPMIIDPASLRSAAFEVLRLAQQAHSQHGQNLSGVVVGAFGDPGLRQLRQLLPVAATGLAEASITNASEGGQKFGIATTTPALEDAMRTCIAELGAARAFTGFRFTRGDPRTLVRDQGRLVNELASAVQECVDDDGAEAVIIGGGPLASSTQQIAAHVNIALVNPVVAACRRAVGLMR